jgi:four helix bundle protein
MTIDRCFGKGCFVIGEWSIVICQDWNRFCPVDGMDRKKSQSDQLEERLIEFASRIIKYATELPKTPAGRHIALQILRSGTAAAPNYAEARGAESRADFVHKLGIVGKELSETSVCCELLRGVFQ